MKPTFEICGFVKEIGAIERISEKFAKRELVIDEGGDYPNPLLIVAQGQATIDMTKKITIGEKVKVTIRVEGKYWEKGGKYFNSLTLASIEVLSEKEFVDEPSFEPSDDLPF